MTKPILDCNLHDYIEIACMYKIEILLTIKGDSKLIGTPITTTIIKNSGEFLVFKAKHTDESILIDLLSLKSMQAISSNPHFDNISLSHN
ncbi:MAG: Rho-binding antiterminator [Alteromonadaceae bacterium]|jgi:Rho-binding antiterminator